MSRKINVPLTAPAPTLHVSVGALASASAALIVGLGAAVGNAGAESLRGWHDLFAAMAESPAIAAEGPSIPMRSVFTPITDRETLHAALAREGLRWAEVQRDGIVDVLVLDPAGHIAVTLQLGDQPATAWMVDAEQLATVQDTALRLDLLTRLSAAPDRILDRLVRRYAALKVAQTLRSEGMTVQERRDGVIQATTRDEVTGGERSIVFDAFGGDQARVLTRHRRAGGAPAPCNDSDVALTLAPLHLAEDAAGAVLAVDTPAEVHVPARDTHLRRHGGGDAR